MKNVYESDFNSIAPFYDLLARIVFGDSLYKAQKSVLQFIEPHDRVLVIGGGTGQTLPDILLREPSEVVFVEKSSCMLERARKRISGYPEKNKVHFLLGKAENLNITGSFNKIVLPFILDLYKETQGKTLLSVLSRYLTSRGKWLVTDFSYGTMLNKGFTAKFLVEVMVRFFRIVANLQVKKLPDWEKSFEEQEGKIDWEKYYFYELIVSRVYK